MSTNSGSSNLVDQKLNGVRLQSSSYGQAVAIVYGQARIPPNIIFAPGKDFGGFKAIEHKETIGSGGKGGRSYHTSFTYTQDVIYALCEGPVAGCTKVWKAKEAHTSGTGVSGTKTAVNETHTLNGSKQCTANQAGVFANNISVKVSRLEHDAGIWQYHLIELSSSSYTVSAGGVYTFPSLSSGDEVFLNYRYNTTSVYASAADAVGLTFYSGTLTQTEFPDFASRYPNNAATDSPDPPRSAAYPGLAYMAATAYDLGNSAELPTTTFEIIGFLPYNTGGGINDALPSAVIYDLATNAYYGAGIAGSKFGSLTQMQNYCIATSTWISPAYSTQQSLADIFEKACQIANTAIVYSDSKIKFIPYADTSYTGNSVTFTPNTTPLWDLDLSDFIVESADEDPIKVTRSPNVDAFNHVILKYYDRLADYNESTVEAKDQANIEIYGLRPKEPVDMFEICHRTTAKFVAQKVLQRSLYIRNQYEFRLGWRYCLLEPMDIVTLTDPMMGLNKFPVRVIEITENQHGDLTVLAEELPDGISSPTLYPDQANTANANYYNAAPGSVVAPKFFEYPFDGTDAIKIGVAVTGNQTAWGGCNVYFSTDGLSYSQIGTIHGGAIYGTLSAAMADTDTQLAVALAGKGGQILTVSTDDAARNVSQCFVDGEFISYTVAQLTGTNAYTLKYLYRALHSSSLASHSSGTDFIKCDSSIFDVVDVDTDIIGKQIYLKFCSFNLYGGGAETIDSVTAYPYTVKGSAFKYAPGDVQNLTNFFRAGRTILKWDAVSDPRPVVYEVRKGQLWKSAQVLGRFTATEFATDGDGQYWVAAYAGLAYSDNPSEIIIEGSALVANVVASFDQAALGWPGVCSGGAAIVDADIALVGTGLWDDIPDFDAAVNVAFYGGVSSAGAYTIPESHEVDIGVSQQCTISLSYRTHTENPFDIFSAIPVFSAITSLGLDLSVSAECKIQIAIAPDSGIYGDWQDFFPGQFIGRKFKFRALLYSYDTNVTIYLDQFAFTVDMPDRVETGTNILCGTSGISVTYSKPFQVRPNEQITILGASVNDDVVITSADRYGFTVVIKNGASNVARSINWLAQGY